MHKFIFILVFLPAIYHANCQPIKKNEASLPDSLTTAVTGNYYTNFHSILISKNGKLFYENYFNGWSKDSLQDSRSAFKSITSILTGIAIDKGLIEDVNQKVYSFFPEFTDFSGNNAWKKEMTIENLLRMESGFDCEEFNDGKDCETEMMNSKDWVSFSLGLPMKHKPGSVWAYTSCDPMILSGIISRVAKMSLMEFVKKAFDLMAKYIIPAFQQ
ncbi:serine hydrolase domain-containing protein [Pseudoflavitalea rhizosphaerae]|uniref:serine hydrolase domain-containing protein n=1 Tax=Pseudoflavitalea rhizosphaerae TaxID=1884793 RepID=UPI000F8D65E0|nr:serine hydrolase [Pseudoflavitalea rhizosphaerae]